MKRRGDGRPGAREGGIQTGMEGGPVAGNGAPGTLLLLGASAGGVQALSEVVKELPGDLPAAVFAVLHVSPYGRSAMPAILSRCGSLPAVHPQDGEAIRRGCIYVAPPDLHLVVEPGTVRLSRGPSENGFRPAVDVLFRTAARSYGTRVVAVILTGNLDDGTAGLAVVKRQGGIAVVQDPKDADYPGMPASAVRNVDIDYVLPLSEIPGVLVDLCRRRVAEPAPDPPGQAVQEGAANLLKEQIDHGADREGGRPSAFTCPLCHGALWQSEDGVHEHFRCRTGHAFSPDSLLALQLKSTEADLWTALRSLEESAALLGRMGRRAGAGGHGADAERFRERQLALERHAQGLHQILTHSDGLDGHT
jgi:two-component system chemotaxis response regulator CheB